MFKNVRVYRVASDWRPTLAEAQSALESARFAPCAATQDKSVGWTEPRGQDHGPMIESVGGQWIARLVMESKSVPGSVLRQHVEERVAAIEASTGRKPGKKERRELKDDALLALLPQAFARQSHVWIWLDLAQGRVLMDAASQAKADEAVSALIRALPGLSLAPLDTAQSPQAAMSQWLLAQDPQEWPQALHVERDCVLQASGEQAASVRYSRHPLFSDEVRRHIQEGKLPTQLALSWDGKLGFVLTDTWILKRIQFLDGVMDSVGSDGQDDRFDADVALATGLLGPVIDGLVEALGGEQTAPQATA